MDIIVQCLAETIGTGKDVKTLINEINKDINTVLRLKNYKVLGCPGLDSVARIQF